MDRINLGQEVDSCCEEPWKIALLLRSSELCFTLSFGHGILGLRFS